MASTTMIDRLIPKYLAFLAVVIPGLFLLLAIRDALIAVWVDKFFDGETQEGLAGQRPHVDRVICCRPRGPPAD